jgi:hypothetical protein
MALLGEVEEHNMVDEPATLPPDPVAETGSASRLTNESGGAAILLPNDAINETGISLTLTSFGDYELLGVIARGGMGVVCRARQVSVNRLVALKMILSGQLASPDDVRRFHSEAEAVARLDHPNIVPIYQVGEHEGRHYFCMKLIEGSSLAAQIPQFREKSALAAELLIGVARAVHHAHQRQILHRDLKPGNILLDRDGRSYITDFGLAKNLVDDSRLTQSGTIVGSPSYMAPEQAAGSKNLTTAVDVYGLGAILYELLTGRPPFRAATPLDTLLQVIEKEPEPPRQVQPHVNLDLETICLKCLRKDPDRRYESAAALADDLERWRRGELILARPVGRLERAWKWAKRRPGAAAALTALVLGTVVFLSLALWALGERERANESAQMAHTAQNLAQTRLAETVREKERAERNLRLLANALAPLQAEDDDATWHLLFHSYVFGREEGKDTEQALQQRISDSEQAVRDLPKDLATTLQLSLMLGLHYLKSAGLVQDHDRQEAIRRCDNAIQILEAGWNPEDLSNGACAIALQIAYRQRAQLFFDSELYQKSRADFERAITYHDPPEDPKLRLDFALCLLQLKQVAEAERSLLAHVKQVEERRNISQAESKQGSIRAINCLIGLYEAWGNPGEAARWRRKLEAEMKAK